MINTAELIARLRDVTLWSSGDYYLAQEVVRTLTAQAQEIERLKADVDSYSATSNPEIEDALFKLEQSIRNQYKSENEAMAKTIEQLKLELTGLSIDRHYSRQEQIERADSTKAEWLREKEDNQILRIRNESQAQTIEELHESVANISRFSARQIRRAEAAEARVRDLEAIDIEATSLYRAVNGLNINEADKRAESFMQSVLDGITVCNANRATIKSELSDNFADLLKRAEAAEAREAKTVERAEQRAKDAEEEIKHLGYLEAEKEWRRLYEVAEARVREIDQQWKEHCQKIHDEAHEIHGSTGKIIADLRKRVEEVEAHMRELEAQLAEPSQLWNQSAKEWRDAVEARMIEQCAKVADFHTALLDGNDYAMGASEKAGEIAKDIRALNKVS